MSPKDKEHLSHTLNSIIWSGFEGHENVYFILLGPNNEAVDLEPRKMSPRDVFCFAEKYYGREARQICQRFSQLSAH